MTDRLHTTARGDSSGKSQIITGVGGYGNALRR